MKQIKIIVQFFILTLITNQHSWTQDSVKVVAVGEAKQLQEKILIETFPCSKLDQEKEINTFAEVTRNDLTFYKKYYDVLLGKKKSGGYLTVPAWNELAASHVDFYIKWQCTDKKREVRLYKVSDKKELVNYILGDKESFSRGLAHLIDDKIFQKLRPGKNIFTSKVVFVAAKEWGKGKSVKEVFVMDFDGYNATQLTHHRGIAISPAFSPDNQKIIYSLIDGTKKNKNISLYEFNIATGKSELILDKAGINSGAVYAQEGKGLYLTLSYKGNSDIYYYDFQTKSEKQLTTNSSEDVDPSLALGKNVLAFLSGRAGKAHVYTMNPESAEKEVKRLSFVGKFNATPRFSPDGAEIVFSSWVDNNFDLYRLSSTGQSLIRLTKNMGSNEDPTYSPDGQFIVFTSRRANGSISDKKIYIMDREGELMGALTNTYALCSSPRLSN
jgi:TolB protein